MKEFILSIIQNRPGVSEDWIMDEIHQCLIEMLNEGVVSIAVGTKGLFPRENHEDHAL